MTDTVDIEQLQREVRTLQLKLAHYRQTLMQKEEQIAELRIEVTDLQEAENAVNNVGSVPVPPSEEPTDPTD